MFNFLLWTIVTVLLIPSKVISQHLETEDNNCSSNLNCKKCITSDSSCAWCSKSSSCFDSRQEDSAGFCPDEFTYNPDNSFSVILANVLSDSKAGFSLGGNWSHNSNDNYVRGAGKLQLRPNSTYRFNFEYSTKDFPVDLYYIVDLPNSVQDEKSKLVKHADTILQEMNLMTNDFFLGFGAVEGGKFINYLPLTKDFENFTQIVNEYVPVENDSITNNEQLLGIINALYNTKSRTNSRHILVVLTTNNDYSNSKIPSTNHTDGSIFNSHRNPLKFYTDGFSQLNELATKEMVHIIFVVKEKDLSAYQELSQKIQGSYVTVLDDKLTAVSELIKFIHNTITEEVHIGDNATDHVQITYSTKCLNNNERVETNRCSGLKKNDVVSFSTEITVPECPKNENDWNEKISIYPVGSAETLIIDLNLICDCGTCMEEPEEYSDKCNHHGKYLCGECQCDPFFSGNQCECQSGENSCLAGNNIVCSGRGSCICGICQCDKRADPQEFMSGKYCECDNFSCDRHNGLLCSGPENGHCECGLCSCLLGRMGPACEFIQT